MESQYTSEIGRYHAHFEPLLKAEQDHIEKQHYDKLREWSVKRLKNEGEMLDGLEGKVLYKSKPEWVDFVQQGKPAKESLPVHKFKLGTSVLISRTNPLVDPVKSMIGEPMTGYVIGFQRNSLRIKFLHPIDNITTGQWRLDIGVNDFAVTRQREALQALYGDPSFQDMSDFPLTLPKIQPIEDEILDQWITSKPPTKEQTKLIGTDLRDQLLRAFQQDFVPLKAGLMGIHEVVQSQAVMSATDVDAVPIPQPVVHSPGMLARNQLIQSWTRRYRSDRPPVVVEGDPVIGLNESQTRAIAMMLGERLSLVQGPPGTGKTRVIIETIKLLKHYWEVPFPILVCAHTNVAVDNVLEGLRNKGVNAVRYGSTDRVPEHLLQYTYEHLQDIHPLKDEIDRLSNQLAGMKADDKIGKKDKAAGTSDNQWVASAQQIGWKLRGLRETMRREILMSADVICTTCLSAVSRTLDDIDFPMVFLDEASMATEPLSLVPLMKGSSHVAIIGDHKQLPPVITTDEARTGGLATSMFERLIHEKHIPSIMLDTQYRMHPSISHFPNRAFYNSSLKDGTAPEGLVKSGFEPPVTAYLGTDDDGKRMNMTFVDHDTHESPSLGSIANKGDGEVICNVVADLLLNNPELKGEDIGIIAPYAAQIRHLTTLLHQSTDYTPQPSQTEEGLEDPYQALTESQIRINAFCHVLPKDRLGELAKIEIKTVDGFEGREKGVILFSTVRCNSAGYIGFLCDWRRLNVGITRAKRALIMVGSASTLRKAKNGQYATDSLPQGGAKIWRDFIGHLEEKGMILRYD